MDGIMLYPDEDGVFHQYNDEFDITIHCESEEDREKVLDYLYNAPKVCDFLCESNLIEKYNQWKKDKGY